MCDLMDCKDCRHLCKNEINDYEVEKLWEDFETVPVGTICKVRYWCGSDVIEYKGKKICDTDSEMAKNYFEEVA